MTPAVKKPVDYLAVLADLERRIDVLQALAIAIRQLRALGYLP
jgi:hypothetical protein